MLTRQHELKGFGKEAEPSGLFTLTFQGRVVDIQLAEEVLGSVADGVWDAFLRQRRTFIDQDGEVE